jgi:hypothetical protein
METVHKDLLVLVVQLRKKRIGKEVRNMIR